MESTKAKHEAGLLNQVSGAASQQRKSSLDHVSPVLRDSLLASQGPHLEACCSAPTPITLERSLPVAFVPVPPWRTRSCSAWAALPTSRHHYHWLASRQPTELRNNTFCGTSHLHSDPGQAPLSPHAPEAETFLPARVRGSPTSTALSILSWQW